MPVIDLQEAKDVDRAIGRVFEAPDLVGALGQLRELFAARLDFEDVTGSVPLRDKELPTSATRIAERDGVQVVAVALPDEGRVPAHKVRRALAEVRRTLGEDVLLVATEGTRSQWHLVYPSYKAGREMLRRMVVHRAVLPGVPAGLRPGDGAGRAGATG